ncbi:MAG TPA: cation diffusion facilitator family transporter, partial [Sphingomonadales bacterium]|nr:cation diffusion facilitator family transporter [Sphingomonadales bacterium]
MTSPHAHHAHTDESRLFQVMALTGIFMLVEIAGGLYSGSLALLADAGHMFTDTAALALAWGAFRASRLPADSRRSYGYARFQVLAALLNGLFLVAIFGWLVWEAVERLMAPPSIKALPMLGVALAGLAINVIAFRVLHRGSKENLNLRAALLHVALDILGSVSTVAAAAVIYFT